MAKLFGKKTVAFLQRFHDKKGPVVKHEGLKILLHEAAFLDRS